MERLGHFLSSLTKDELEIIKDSLNLTDDEEAVFNELSRGRSKVAVADKCLISCSTVDRRIHDINQKLSRVKKVVRFLT